MLWAAEDAIDGELRELIKHEADAVVVSTATVWEIEIKRALGRLEAPNDVGGLVERSGFERLAIEFDHAREAGRLPPIHSDPFDRMLIAQAQLEGLTLATSDEAIVRYDVSVIAVTRG